jgi:hypothetical protein
MKVVKAYGKKAKTINWVKRKRNEQLAEFVFHVAFTNCALQQFDYWSSVDDFDKTAKYYNMQRQHHAAATKAGARVAATATKELTRKGLAGLRAYIP